MLTSFITWTAKPEIFSIGTFSIRWYGILFAMGFFVGFLIMQRFFKKEGIPLKVLDRLATYMIIATIIGARLGHCFFYEPEYYLRHPLEILKIWEGGLASHGATVGILLALYYFARKFNVTYFWVLDRIAIVTALAGFFIRMGNLMNSEIYGKPTTLPWGFIFVNTAEKAQAMQPRHPTQIYEGLAYLAIFFYLLTVYYKRNGKPREGFLISMFLILIFSARFLIEFLKEPQVAFEQNMVLNLGQLLSIPFILAGVIILFLIYQKKETSDLS